MKKEVIALFFKLYGMLRGGEIHRVYRAVRTANDRMELIGEREIKEYLLSHGYLGDLQSAPLMGKAEITAKLPGIDKSKIKSYIYTGGSYGEPFKLPYSGEREMIRTATFRYFNEIAGYTLGAPYLLIAAKPRAAWSQFLRNEYRFVPRNLTETRIAEVAHLISRKRIGLIVGFSSVITDLATYMTEHKIKHQVKAIIFTSEPVDPIKSAFIRKAFGCVVTDRYSNEEVGLIAQQRVFGGLYYTNRYNVLVEILDEEGRPVKSGEMGRVVVTDLKSDLVPVIRYDTGDLAVAHEYKGGQLISLRSIAGRVAERIYTPAGEAIAPLAFGPLIHKPMSESNCYHQFQFAQTGQQNYELRLKDGGMVPAEVSGQILNNLKNILGKGATVNVIFVEDIPPLRSGKRPIYVNEWSNIKRRSDV